MKFPKNPDGFTILKFTDSIYLLKPLEYFFYTKVFIEPDK